MELGEVAEERPIVVAEDAKKVKARTGGDLSRCGLSNSRRVSGLANTGLV